MAGIPLTLFLIQIFRRHTAGMIVICGCFNLMLPLICRLFKLFGNLLLVYGGLTVTNRGHLGHVGCPWNQDLQVYRADIQSNSPHFFSPIPIVLFKRTEPDFSSIGRKSDITGCFLNGFDQSADHDFHAWIYIVGNSYLSAL